MMRWRDRPPEEKAALERLGRRGGRAVLEQWADENVTGRTTTWNKRAYWAAGLISEPVKVLDIGCGDMFVETLLPEGSTYIPLDCIARDEQTIVLDLNRDPLPTLDVDLVLVLGVLEHLYDVPKFLQQLARFPRIILSYNPAELLDPTDTEDRELDGVSLFTSRKLERLFARYGLEIVQRAPYQTQMIYELTT